MENVWLVEHAERDTDGDSVQLARWLAQRGYSVVLAGPRQLKAAETQNLEGMTLTQDLRGPARAALLDVWTAETDPRVQNLRRQGVATRCLADLLLEERGPFTVGITGTAGKSTTAWLVWQLLGAEASLARAGNLWPTTQLLKLPPQTRIVAELTSSHLAFCRHSPAVAAITNFWPDHVELHGSLEAYARAKSQIFLHQSATDWAVLPGDDPAAAVLAEASPAQRLWYADGPERRVWIDRGRLRVDDRRWDFPPGFDSRPRQRALLCAVACALAAGAELKELPPLQLPPHRYHLLTQPGDPLEVVDDSLAATPAKALQALTPGCRLVAGGLREIDGRAVHTSPDELQAMDQWLEAIQQNCASVDLFGSAGEMLARRIQGEFHPDLMSALKRALSRGSQGRLVVSPGFPMEQSQRQAIATQVLGPTLD